MAARLSALRASRTLPPGFFIFKNSWYSFLLEAESTPGPVLPEGLGQFKTTKVWDLKCYYEKHVFLNLEGYRFRLGKEMSRL
jgi:hypothetical protein